MEKPTNDDDKMITEMVKWLADKKDAVNKEIRQSLATNEGIDIHDPLRLPTYTEEMMEEFGKRLAILEQKTIDRPRKRVVKTKNKAGEEKIYEYNDTVKVKAPKLSPDKEIEARGLITMGVPITKIAKQIDVGYGIIRKLKQRMITEDKLEVQIKAPLNEL